MRWNNVKPSQVYGRRATVERALQGSGWRVSEFRPPRIGDMMLAVGIEGTLRPMATEGFNLGPEQPRFILTPGEFRTWWE